MVTIFTMSPTFRYFLSIYGAKQPVLEANGRLICLKTSHIKRRMIKAQPIWLARFSKMSAAHNDQAPAHTSSTPIDNGGGSADDGRMEARTTALEKDVSELKTDVAIIRSNYVTKEDFHRELHAATWRIIGAIAILNATIFFAARTTGSSPPPSAQHAAAPAAPTTEQPKAAAPTTR